MAKRPHDSRGTAVKIKRRNGIRIRTVTAPDSDDDNSASNVDTEYARSFKTRVSAAGRAESVTMKSVRISEARELPQGDPDFVVNDYEEVIMEKPISSKKAKKRRKVGNDSVSVSSVYIAFLLTAFQTKMLTWLDVRSTVLDEMITLDGPGSHQLDSCNLCGDNQTTSLYRCLECSYALPCCGECVLKSHTTLPLHRLEVSLHFLVHSSSTHNFSAGRTAFSTGPLLIHSDTSAILGMMATHVLPSPLPSVSLSLTSTAGISYKSAFANVAQVGLPTSTTANSFVCAGIPLPSVVRRRLSRSISSKPTTS